MDAAWACGPEVAGGIDFEAVAAAFEVAAFGHGGDIGEDAGGAEGAVWVDGEGFPEGGVAIGLGDVEGFLVGAEGDSVRERHFFGEEGDDPVWGDLVDPVPVEFAGIFVGGAFGETVGRVGEVEIARFVEAEVVWAVEAAAVEVVCERAFAAVFGEDGDAAVAVFAEGETA